MKCSLLLFLSLPFLAGCASKHYSEFTGGQAWLTSSNAAADERYVLPVYWNWPARPYRVMGSIHGLDCKGNWEDADTAQSARIARGKGGDALLMMGGEAVDAVENESPVGSLVRPAEASALMIQWKSQSDIDEESHRLAGLKAYLKRSYPALGLGNKNDLWIMAVQYVTWLGLDINLPRGAAKVEETLSHLAAANSEANSSPWLFQATLRAEPASRERTEIRVLGIATLTQTRDTLAIVSHSQKAMLTFSAAGGTNILDGTIEFSTGATRFSGRAEGELLPDRISLSSKGEVDGAAVLSTFLFLR
jgi:hypothetical protein